MSDKPETLADIVAIEASPRPWRVEENVVGWSSFIVDANGNSVASCRGGGPTEQQEKAEAIAALIVAAVNERDRLRDLVRRLADDIERYHLVGERDRALLREARAAIGEDAK
jgi:hypothetical protein